MLELDQYRDSFYQSILLMQNMEDVEDSLPKPEYISFFPLMAGLLEAIDEAIESSMKELDQLADDLEMKELLSDEIQLLLAKKQLVEQKIREGKQILSEQEESIQSGNKKTIIFAKTEAGNVYFERDLKDIPREYYDDIIKCLESLEQNIQESNVEKAKAFRSNAKLIGLHEIKDFKVRVVYKFLTPDTVYVMLVRLKKDNNSALDRDSVIIRSNQTEKDYKSIKKQLSDELQKMMILDEHVNIKERIIQKMKTGDWSK